MKSYTNSNNNKSIIRSFYCFVATTIMIMVGCWQVPSATSFVLLRQQQSTSFSTTTSTSTSSSSLYALYTPGRSSASPRSSSNNGGGGRNDKSKRQYRVGELVRTELANILHTGIIRGKGVTYLDDELRQRISIVSVDVSPDLRQARVSVSIRNPSKKNNNNNDQATTTTTTTDQWEHQPIQLLTNVVHTHGW